MQRLIALALRSALYQTDAELLANCLNFYRERAMWTRAGEAQHFGAAVELWVRDAAKHPMLAELCGALAILWTELRQYPRALQTYQAVLDDSSARSHHGMTCHNMGIVYQMQQQWQLALDAYQRALELKKQHGQQCELSSTYHQIGMVHQKKQQWSEALNAYQRALEFQEQHEAGVTYHQIGRVHEEQCQWQEALETYQRALKLYRQHGQQHEAGDTCHQIGIVYEEQQMWQQALDAYQRALELYEQHGQQHQLGWHLPPNRQRPRAARRVAVSLRLLSPRPRRRARPQPTQPRETTNNPSRAPTRQLRPTKPPIAAAPWERDPSRSPYKKCLWRPFNPI